MRSASHRTPVRLALVSLLAFAALACAACPATAQPWGELEVFKPRTFSEHEEARRLTADGAKFAAAPNGTYYVLSQGEFGKFVLQRFRGDELQAATPEFEPPSANEDNAAEAVNAALAVDPNPNGESGRERVYVLFEYSRRGPDSSEENHEPEQFPLDSEMPAAGSLYAFKYEDKQLVSAKTEEVKKKQVPAPALDRAAMHSEAEEEHASSKNEHPRELEPAERPLLDPRGMAVNPATGDLAISANEDDAPMERVQKEEGEKQCRAAVQFVKTTGGSGQLELSFGARYVDKQAKVLFGKPLSGQPETGCGEAAEEERGVEQAPASPVFAPDGSVLGYDEAELEAEGQELEGVIWQLTPPLTQAQEEALGAVQETTPQKLFIPKAVEPFEAFNGEKQPASVMSLVPAAGSSTEGTIYLSGVDGFDDEPAATVLHYSTSGDAPSITEVGWIGGAKENEFHGTVPCNIHAYRESYGTMLGGLSGGGFLALAFYEEEGPDRQKAERKFYAEVVDFGEGGKTEGCPTVSVTKPVASYRGAPAREVEAGTGLAISSVLGVLEPNGATKPEAAAKSVTWTVKFTSPEGAHEETSYPMTYEQALPSELAFDYTPAKVGTYEITDVVRTDDLADEVAQPTEADKLTVTAGTLKVQLHPPEPSEVHATEQEATLTAEVHGEEKERLKKVVWEFGEGAKDEEASSRELPATLQVKHTFNRCATARCKVVVTVEAETASHSVQKATGQVEITVKPSKAEEEAENHTNTTGNTNTTPATTTPTTTTPVQTPHQEVQAYIATFSGSSLLVSASGATQVKVTCPSGGSCSGTLTLQTLKAVATSHNKHAKKKILTLASGSFALAGGSKFVTLHLSATARALLSGDHGALPARLTIVSRGVGGQKNNTTTHPLTLRLVKPHKKSHKH
jgi:hypothetical protein